MAKTGKPSIYKNNNVYWSGVNVVEYGNNTFTYDTCGRRLTKNNLVYTYDSNGKLIRQSNGLEFFYDHTGVAGMKYNGTTYIYRKDVQGNIIALLDSNGRIVVKYAYDAWGNHTVYDANGNINTNANFIGNINPFRYRGYYYDVETGLYYLNTRYYDPFACRFINADDISYIEPETIGGLNLYAYCLNNPIIYSDPYGTWSWSSFWRGLGYIITGVGAIVAGALVMASGVALVPMLIAAGVTIGAGALTTINGAAEIGEAIGGYNYMKDGVFGGNATAYNIYAGITDGIAMIGAIICGAWLKVNAPRIQAYKNIEAYSRTQTVANHTERAYNDSILLQKQVVKYGKMTKDLGSATGYVFEVCGSFNGSEKLWRLVLSNTERIVLHFGFGF